MNYTTIAIADPSLRDNRGHHFELTKNLSPSSLPADLRLIWLVNQDFHDAHNTLTIYPVFSYTMYDRYFSLYKHFRFFVSLKKRIKNLLRKLKIYSVYRLIAPNRDDTNTNKVTAPEILADELLDAINQAALRSEDHILFHTSDAPVYWAVLLLFLQNKPDNLPAIHLSTPYDTGFMPNKDIRFPVDLSIALLQGAGVLGEKVFLYAETDILAGHLANHWKVDVKPLCLPPPEIEIKPHNEGKKPITITMLGAAREEKGFLMLPDIAESLWDEFGQNGQIRFIIQCNPQIIGYSPNILETIDQLRSYNSDYVQLIETQQSSEEYYNCMRSSDIILLIYDRNKYGNRGSGIAIESVSIGIPMLTTSGTFPESLLEFGAGEAASDIQGYIHALKKIVNDYPAYHRKALNGSSHYRKKYSADKYLNALISNSKFKHSSVKNKHVLIYSTETPGFSACCRLLEKIYYFMNLGFQVDVFAHSALIERLERPDKLTKLRLYEYFQAPSLPESYVKLISGAYAERLEISFTPLLHTFENRVSNPNIVNKIRSLYSIIVTDSSQSIRVIKKIFKNSAIIHTSLYYSVPSPSIFRTIVTKFTMSSGYIAPYTKITAITVSDDKIKRAVRREVVLAPPLSTGKINSFSYCQKTTAIPDGSIIKTTPAFDITVFISNEIFQQANTNEITQRLLSRLNCSRKLRIAVVNSDNVNRMMTEPDNLNSDVLELINTTSVLLVENDFNQDSIYRLLTIYHYVPLVSVLLTDNNRIPKKLVKLRIPVFLNPEEAADFLNKNAFTYSGLATASWKTYLSLNEIFGIDNYIYAWQTAINEFGGLLNDTSLYIPVKTWSAPSRAVVDRS